MSEPKNYEFELRLLNIQVFAVKFVTSSDSKSWLGVGLLAILLFIGIILIFGKDLLNVFGMN